MNKKALTLVEIIISVLIITVVCAGMLGAFVGGHQLMNRSRHRIQALNFAREALDKLMSNYQYGSTQMSEDVALNPHDESEIGDNIIRGEMDNLSTTLTYTVAAEPQTNSYKEAEVTVAWTETSF